MKCDCKFFQPAKKTKKYDCPDWCTYFCQEMNEKNYHFFHGGNRTPDDIELSKYGPRITEDKSCFAHDAQLDLFDMGLLKTQAIQDKVMREMKKKSCSTSNRF